MKQLSVILLSVAAASGPALADAQPGVLERAALADTLPQYGRAVLLANPAMQSLRLPVTISHIEAGWDGGRDRSVGFFRANSFMALGNGHHVLGQAGYSNGTLRDVSTVQNADAHLVYPYLMGVEATGDMRSERYNFGGTYWFYAPESHPWGWGATARYDAGLSYRNVDPRPRNVTGMLNLAAAASYTLRGRYTLALGMSADIYKQSNNLTFVSELGELPVYHLTGLGTVYHRFTSLGKDAFYKGRTYGLNIAASPVGMHGLYAGVNLSTGHMENILKDLNELPMARVTDRSVSAEAGWMGSWTPFVRWEAGRRRGTENFFGDASSGVYPQIAEATTYAQNRYSASVGAHGWAGPVSMLAHAGYDHSAEAYGGDRPRSGVSDMLTAGLGSRYAITFASDNLIIASAGVDSHISMHRRLSGLGDSPMEVFAKSLWRADASGRSTLNLAAEYSRRLSRVVALGLDIRYYHTFSSNNYFEPDRITVSAKLYL